jgi:hypothetical protein
MQKPKSVEKTTIGNNAGQEYMAGKHKRRQSLDLHSLSVQVQQQHPLHSHMCKPIDAPSSFKVLLVRSIVVNPRNERLETQNTKGFRKRRREGLQQSEHHHHQQQKQHKDLQNPNFREDTFHQQNAKPKENRENIRVWVGGKKGQGRRRCKEELQKTKKPRTHIPMFLEQVPQQQHPLHSFSEMHIQTLDDRFFFNFLVKWI